MGGIVAKLGIKPVGTEVLVTRVRQNWAQNPISHPGARMLASSLPVAMTSEQDLGKFTLEAALLNYGQPENKMQDELEVYSCQMTMKEYAQVFDNVAGRPTKLEFIQLDDIKEEYKSGQNFELLIRILLAEGAYDYTKSVANELLNPGSKSWKLKTIQEYAEETGGRPWKDYK